MPSWLRNALAIVAGFMIGGLVNSALIALGPSLIPPPVGVDVSSAESLKQGIRAYIPMAWLPARIGTRLRERNLAPRMREA